MSKPKQRTTVRIINPAPEGAGYTSLRRAVEFVELNRAEWVGVGRVEIRMLHTVEQLVTNELAARHRLLAQIAEYRVEHPVEQYIEGTRYGQVSWSGSKHSNRPHWQTPVPIAPGMARS